MEFGIIVISNPPEVEFRLHRLVDRGRDGAQLVTQARLRNHIAALIGRLYYRDERLAEIGPRLSKEFAAECTNNDAALALAVYVHAGAPALARLEGDFAVVIWDGESDALIARRDPLGAYPLFWTKHGSTVAIATNLRPLLQLLPARKVSLDHLADFLVRPPSNGERAAQGCAYEGVHRLTPDTMLRIELDTGRVAQERCWSWLEQAVDPGTDRLDEIAAGYADRLNRAVRERIRGRTASHLSGGMDSTSVCLLARDLERLGIGQPPLHALSLVYERLPSLARERRYIDSVLESDTEGLVGHAVVADELLDFDEVPDPPFHDEPFAGLSCLQTERALCGMAAELGIDTILTGRGADELLDAQPYHLTDWLRSFRYYAAWREASAWAEARGSTSWRIMYQFGLRNLFPTWRHGLLGKIFSRSSGIRGGVVDEWSIPSWIRPDFARQYTLAERIAANARQMHRGDDSTPTSLALHGLQRRVGEAFSWLTAVPNGIALCHPFLDTRVLRFGLGMQARLTPSPEPVKPVLAEAMRGVLPEAIQNRRDKRSFNEVYYLGLRRNLPALRAMIAQAPIDGFGLIDKTILMQTLEEGALGAVDAYRLTRLDVTLSLISWLSRQPAWQAQSSSPSEIIHASARSVGTGSHRDGANPSMAEMSTSPGGVGGGKWQA